MRPLRRAIVDTFDPGGRTKLDIVGLDFSGTTPKLVSRFCQIAFFVTQFAEFCHELCANYSRIPGRFSSAPRQNSSNCDIYAPAFCLSSDCNSHLLNRLRKSVNGDKIPAAGRPTSRRRQSSDQKQNGLHSSGVHRIHCNVLMYNSKGVKEVKAGIEQLGRVFFGSTAEIGTLLNTAALNAPKRTPRARGCQKKPTQRHHDRLRAIVKPGETICKTPAWAFRWLC